MTLQMHLHELCKVRNASLKLNRKSRYSTAIIKKVNKNSARVALISDATCKESHQTYFVKLDSLWKLKASQRKALEHKIKRKTMMPVNKKIDVKGVEKHNLLGIHVDEKIDGLKVVAKMSNMSDTILHVVYDSIINFTGDAIVNAANQYCIGGGGIDGEINKRGGQILMSARHNLPIIETETSHFNAIRCHTGNAVITTAGALPCNFVIHAVGPQFSYDYNHTSDLDLLKNAYANAIRRAEEQELKSVAFCILSGGIFRGSCPLKTVINVGLNTLLECKSSLKNIFFCAFTSNEQAVLGEIVASFEDCFVARS